MSIQRRPKTGKDKNGRVRWVARYRDGSGKEHSKTFATKTDAKNWEAEQLRALRSGTWIDPIHRQSTVGDLVRDYRDSAARPKTREAWTTYYNALGELHDVPVGKLTAGMIRKWVAGRSEAWAPRTLSNAVAFLNTVLNKAVEDGVIAVNPGKGIRVSVPSKRLSADDVPAPADVMRLIRAVEDGRLCSHNRVERAAMVRLAAATGMRRGELLGLRPCDVNELAGTITVGRQRGGRPLKTQSSYRVISVDSVTMATILAVSGERYIFESLGYGAAQKIMDRAHETGLWPRRWTFHSLRHFHATQLLSAGVPVKAVSARLGHSSAAMTLDVYAHLLPADDALAAGIVGDLLRDNCGMEGRGDGGLRAVK
ncbi:tyrosine-type recombinase/integrase [Corynebacterium pygosceleis]|uniref:tyrosine-type recombinase/integrase n=1 Tax=Corynebacterium pygosceleis TaxID=2800406 RepID=UPI00200695F8|nr:site-specific integrase [Corynebacterium pygosceleis]MCK7676215.1 site-specific integrase [Corynebacterium pygosceleis]